MQDGELIEANPRSIPPEELVGSTVFTPHGSYDVVQTYEGEQGEEHNYLAVYENRLGGKDYSATGGPNFQVLTKPLENMFNTQDKNCERILKNPEWYTPAQVAACGG
jgi:hypothetical protein